MSDLEAALQALQAGGLVVIPTDTVYGVACVPSRRDAVEALFRAKGRPEDRAIPVLGHEQESLHTVASFSERADEVARRYWPGPLTLVLPRAPDFDHDLGGSADGTIAVRVPESDVARSLLKLAGPLAVTSANLSGRPPAKTVAEARAALGDSVDVYLDGGACTAEPSTVLSLVGEPTILRPGTISKADLEALL